MAPKPMPVRISKPGLKNVFEYWNFRNGSIFLPARLASREVAVVSNPFQPAFSVWVTSQFASIHQIGSAWTCLCKTVSSLVKNVPMLTSLRMSPFCVFLWSRCRPTGGRSGLQLQRLGFPFKERFERKTKTVVYGTRLHLGRR